MDDLLEICLTEADSGKRLLERHLRDSGLGSDEYAAILIFPTDDAELLSAAYNHLNEFVTSSRYEALMCVASININEERIRDAAGVPTYFHSVTDEDMAKILRFGTFATPLNLKMFSLDLWTLENSRKLLGYKNVTMEMLVYYSILGLHGEFLRNNQA
ncbi:MAG: hypothetical protein LBG71_02460 [Clostridiales Family XIII bacterium]|jgi:hypothetical protein|nr:hypothetical protein [Clostridiales Family XIII bacterium]